MDFREIGPLSVSTVGLGCNNFARKLDRDASAAVVNAALDAGVNFFDTADRYGYGDHPYSGQGRSEEFLGSALGSVRPEVIVATKFGNPMGGDDPTMRGGGEKWVRQACEDSLRRLGTDYIDLYQIHRPDTSTPVAETLGALNDLVDQGKVRVIGCSNFTAAQLEEATAVAGELGSVRFQSVQNEYSLLIREPEEEVLETCEKLDISFLPYFPLASGLLTGKYRKDQPIPEGSRLAFWEPRPHFSLDGGDVLDRVEAMISFAAESNHTLLELAISWLLSQPKVASVISGATSPSQVKSNVAAAGWELSDDDLERVADL